MTEPLTIAMLSLHSSPIGRLGTGDTGGMSVYLMELGRALGERGHRIDIFTREVKGKASTPVTVSTNVRIICLAVPGTRGLVKDELYDHLPVFQSQIERFSQEQRCSYDCVHSNYWLSGVVGERLKKKWECPHLITFHTMAGAKITALSDHRENRLRLQEEDRLLACSDGVMVATAVEREQLAAQYGNMAPVYLVPLGVDLEQFKPLPAESAVQQEPGQSPQILFVGRFDPMKGVDSAISALTHLDGLPRPELVLVGGDGQNSESRRRLERLVGDLRLENRVHFAGSVDRLRMPEMYRRADMVVAPSYYESFGLVVLEALACGIPVAATPTGIAAEVIVPGLNGCLATAGDSRSLAGAITETLHLALSQDPLIIRQSVRDYGWSQVADSVLSAYSGALSPK